MKQAYVVTAGRTDIDILRKLLPSKIVKSVNFVAGNGYDSARSLATSLLAVKRLPVALVMDTDSLDENTIHDKVEFSKEWMSQTSGGVPFEIVPAIPEIETVFFQDKKFIERITNRRLSEAEWKLAKLHPKDGLLIFLGERESLHKMMLDQLKGENILEMQKHSLITKLSEFLSSVISNGAKSARE